MRTNHSTRNGKRFFAPTIATLLALLLLPLAVMAQTKYVITAASTTQFTATKGSETVGTANQPIQTVINAIKGDAGGEPCEIQFGDGEDLLDIGTSYVEFDGGESGSDWGLITLNGKITSAIPSNSNAVILLSKGTNAESKADITSINGIAIKNDGTGTLTINGGTITGLAYAVVNNGGTLTINDGTIAATLYAIMNNPTYVMDMIDNKPQITYTGGILTITGGNIMGNINSGIECTVAISGGNISEGYIWGETIEITGGTITDTMSIAVNFTKSLSLGGSPDIEAIIVAGKDAENLSLITQGEKAFVPAGKTYTLNFNSYLDDNIAVENGKDYLANFKLANEDWMLDVNGNDLVVKEAGYEIDQNGTTYVITKVAGGIDIQNTIVSIKNFYAAQGADCFIQFGNGETLNIGSADITFEDLGKCGQITLTGKIAKTMTGGGSSLIALSNNASVNSQADITTTVAKYPLENKGTGTLTISGGTVASTATYAVNNATAGNINISGGTISSESVEAIRNAAAGKIAISGDAKITSANASATGGTVNIASSGALTETRLEINGGTIENTADGGNAIYNASTGAAIVSGGTISVTTGTAIHNSSTGKIAISGNAKITSANTNATGGTINIASSGTAAAMRLEITGGTIENTADGGNAVYNASTGSISLGGKPTVIGKIRKASGASVGGLSVITEGENIFAPASEKTYFLDFANYTAGTIAVTNGAEFIYDFALANSNFSLWADGLDLVIGPTGTAKAITVTGGDNGTASANPASARNGIQITLTATPDEGYRLKEWEVLSGGVLVSSTNPATFIMPNRAVEVKAVFELIPTYYTVSFYNEGEEWDSHTIAGGTVVEEPDEPTKEGFTFLGWFKELLTELWNFATDLVTGDTKLYAKWQENSSSSDGEEIELSSSSSNDGEAESSSSSEETESSSSSETDNSSSSETNDYSSSSGGEVPIHTPQIASGNIRAYATNGSIVLENLPSNAKVEVYSLRGERVYANAGAKNLLPLHIPVQTKGIYIAKAGAQSFRIAVR